MDIYIKPKQKVIIIKKKAIFVKDVCDIFVSGGECQDAGNLPLLNIKSDKDTEIAVSVIDIVKALNQKYPNATVSNLGETDTLIEYKSKEKKPIKFIEILKVVFICLILFAGSATTIMSFHADAEIPEIFGNIHYLAFGEYRENAPIITIPYTIGLGTGIIVFFNHFSKKYITKDPTPIEVQMTTYENETITSILANLDKKKDKGNQ